MESGIVSGRTIAVREELEGLFERSVDFSIFEAWKDEHVIEVDKSTILRMIDRCPIVPTREYLLRYLIVKNGIDCDSRDVLDFYDQNLEYAKAAPAVQLIIDRTFDQFFKNGLGIKDNSTVRGNVRGTGRGWNKDAILKVIMKDNISADNIFLFAFGLGMSYDHLNQFLTRALKRAKLNLWNEEEFLIYLTFRYAGGSIAFFDKCCDEYKNAKPQKIVEGFEGTDNTSAVEEAVDRLVRKFEEENSVMSLALSSDGSVPKEICSLIAEYKSFIEICGGRVGTKGELAAELLADVKKYSRPLIEDVRLGDDADKKARGIVTVFYDPKLGVDIPDGTIFSSMKKDEYGQCRRVEFESTVDVSVQGCSDDISMNAELSVICRTEEPKCEKPEEQLGYVPGHSVFTAGKDTGILSAENKSYFKTDKKAKIGELTRTSGKIFAKCLPGYLIEAGTVLQYDDGEKIIEFELVKDVDTRISVDVPVRGCEDGEEAAKNEITDCSISGWKKLFSIENKKISTIEKGIAGQRGALYPFLYGFIADGEDIGDNIEQEQFRKLDLILKGTKLANDKLSQISSKSEPNISRNDILTLTFLRFVTYEAEFFGDVGNMIDYVISQDVSSSARNKKTVTEMTAAQRKRRMKAAAELESARETLEELRGEFVRQADNNLRRCGYYGFYPVNPYDGLLMLLLAGESPITLFRELWGLCSKLRSSQR